MPVDIYSAEYRASVNREPDWEIEEEDINEVDHEAKVTILKVAKMSPTGELVYTILIKDKLNLAKPVAVDLPLSPDEAGRLKANIVFPEDLEHDYGIKVE